MNIFKGILKQGNLNQFTGIKSITNAGLDVVVQTVLPNLDNGFKGVCFRFEEGTLF